MKRAHKRALILALCAAGAAAILAARSADILLLGRSVEEGLGSGIATRSVVVLHNEEEWEGFWRGAAAEGSAKSLDFADGPVIVAAHGNHPNTCARPPTVRSLGPHVFVNFDDRDGPGSCGSMVTTPYKVVQLSTRLEPIVHGIS